MIYVDTVSGTLVIDTEIGRVSETIVITRNATGLSVKYVDLQKQTARSTEKHDTRLQFFYRLLCRPITQIVRGV